MNVNTKVLAVLELYAQTCLEATTVSVQEAMKVMPTEVSALTSMSASTMFVESMRSVEMNLVPFSAHVLKDLPEIPFHLAQVF